MRTMLDCPDPDPRPPVVRFLAHTTLAVTVADIGTWANQPAAGTSRWALLDVNRPEDRRAH